MTDKEVLFAYRLKQAEETLADAVEHVKNAKVFIEAIKAFINAK